MITDYLELLLNDHALIEKALVLIEKEVKNNYIADLTTFKTLLDFLWDYGDQCHNMKEEKIYFPLLIDRGLPPGGPIQVMLAEHDQERIYINELKKMIADYESSGSLAANFEKTLKEYSELTKGHIWKENDILYPMGKRIINEYDLQYLIDKFIEIELETVGNGGYYHYFNLINTIEKKSGEKINLITGVDPVVLNNMLDALPVELSFVDANDRVQYFSHLTKKKIFGRTLGVIGRTVQQCHPQKSVHIVNQLLAEMKAGKRDKATFWIHLDNMLVHISYFAVRSEEGTYQGCVEMVHDVQPYRELEGDKRLLDGI
jgi:uncharacterized protein